MTSTAVIWSKLKPEVKFQYGGRLGEFNDMSFESLVSHCRVLPPGEFNVMIPEPHVTLQGERIPSAIPKIVIRRIFFCFLNAIWASASDGFRIVSDTLIVVIIIIDIFPRDLKIEKGNIMGMANQSVHLLSASLYFSKRGAY